MIAGSQTIAGNRRQSQTIAEDRTWFYLLRSSAITIAGSQTIADDRRSVFPYDRRTFCDLRSYGNQPLAMQYAIRSLDLPFTILLPTSTVFNVRTGPYFLIFVVRENKFFLSVNLCILGS